jgi:methyl-accepting chemotaxis protein
MKNLKIAQKLIISFVIVIALAVIIGVVGIIGMLNLNTAQGAMYDSNTAPLGDLANAQQTFQRIRASVRANEVNGLTNDPEGVKTTTTQTEGFQKEFVAALDAFEKTIVATELKTRFSTMRNSYEKDYVPFLKEINQLALELALDEGNEGVDAMIAKINGMGSVSAQLSDDLDWCLEFKIDDASSKNVEGDALFQTLLIVIIVVIVVAAIASIALALYISRGISKPVLLMLSGLAQVGNTGDLVFPDEVWAMARKEAAYKDEVAQSIAAFIKLLEQFIYYGEQLQAVASKDLTIDIKTLGGRDTIGIALSTMVDNLNEMFGEINSSASQVSTGSQQIANGAQSLAQGSTEQAAASQQLSSSISEVAASINEAATMAKNAAELAANIQGIAEHGTEQMSAMMDAVREINDASQNISKVIKVIDDIAFQTNILALNAAVEAARAGSAGKGFAVVAEEVRSLAAKSADAAKDTGTLIESSIEKAELGVKIASETNDSLTQIVEGIVESNKISNDIAESSDRQAVAIAQINTGIDQVAQVVQQNSATAEESAAASEELSGQSSLLSDMIAQFKLKGAAGLPGGKKTKRIAAAASKEQADAGFGKY